MTVKKLEHRIEFTLGDEGTRPQEGLFDIWNLMARRNRVENKVMSLIACVSYLKNSTRPKEDRAFHKGRLPVHTVAQTSTFLQRLSNLHH
jgi:hypothetical protein